MPEASLGAHTCLQLLQQLPMLTDMEELGGTLQSPPLRLLLACTEPTHMALHLQQS